MLVGGPAGNGKRLMLRTLAAELGARCACELIPPPQHLPLPPCAPAAATNHGFPRDCWRWGCCVACHCGEGAGLT